MLARLELLRGPTGANESIQPRFRRSQPYREQIFMMIVAVYAGRESKHPRVKLLHGTRMCVLELTQAGQDRALVCPRVHACAALHTSQRTVGRGERGT